MQGYVLSGDGRTCTDVDECASQRHHCPHACVNTPGSYECRCEDGFRVEGRVCVGTYESCSDGSEGWSRLPTNPR